MANEIEPVSISYPEAVELAIELLERWKESDVVWDMAGGLVAADFLRENPRFCLAWAADDAKGFDYLKNGIAQMLLDGEELPPAIAAWLVAYLREQVSRPKAKAGRSAKSWMHLKICFVIRRLCEKGMIATRNDVSEQKSACDAVADALARLELEPATFDGVKHIWFGRSFEGQPKTN